MANLGSSIIYGNLDVKGYLTINGKLISDIGNVSNEKITELENADNLLSEEVKNLKQSMTQLESTFTNYQGPLELQVTNTHIQWRKAGTQNWINLIALSSLTPSITELEKQINNLKTTLIEEFKTLENNINNSLNVNISNAEIDTVISNALK